ncbi:class I SAM-dependent methyltransferase [Halolamina sp. C58]|uniref:class I SAM-dependent methyltransferase n=1 Tax=Halolamina sp. C58 TaxID=3421640 RepID=UPI003EBFD1E6
MNPEDVREEWAERTGEFSPTYYAHKGPNEASEQVRDLVSHFLDREARVLEIGCSSGRHLAHLHDGGLENLHGIEINADAIDVLREEYPDLAADATFHVGDAAAILPEFDDGAFDAVYSVETLQHIHPDEAETVFDEVARVTGDLLLTVENESARGAGAREAADVSYVNDEFPLYHRDWKAIFEQRGFAQLLSESSKRRDTLRAFRRP